MPDNKKVGGVVLVLTKALVIAWLRLNINKRFLLTLLRLRVTLEIAVGSFRTVWKVSG